jgi:ABC-type Mn2+/Zn2+ transport system permease subunit
MDVLVEPFAYDFFRNGLAVAAIAGALCGMVGVFVVLKGMSYIGHGLSHAIFGGAVASFVAKINFYVGAGLWGLVSALMIHRVARRRTIGADAAIGVITTASFAVGVALISRHRSFTRNFEAALFGNVLGVTAQDILIVGVVAVASAGLIFIRYRALLFATFDPDVAEVSGLKTGLLDALLALILAASILATMQVLGVTLIVAALVVPAVIARMLTDRFARMIQLSTVIGALMGFFGVYLSYYLDIASGPAVVLFGSAAFALVFLITGARRLRWIQTGERAADL